MKWPTKQVRTTFLPRRRQIKNRSQYSEVKHTLGQKSQKYGVQYYFHFLLAHHLATPNGDNRVYSIDGTVACQLGLTWFRQELVPQSPHWPEALASTKTEILNAVSSQVPPTATAVLLCGGHVPEPATEKVELAQVCTQLRSFLYCNAACITPWG